MAATRTEERCSNINKELFEITEEMSEEIKMGRLGYYKFSPLFEVPEDEIIEGSNENKKYNFREYNQDQIFIIPVSKDKFLESNHPAIIIDTIIERLDLTKLYMIYSNEGNPPYHPKMMLKVLFYAYYDGIMSCRTIWDSVIHRSDFIFLAAGQVPDFRTINNFRLRHLDDLHDLFTQIVMMCKELDMIDFKHLAIDGEKIQANASYRNSKNLKGIKKEYEKLKEGLKKLLEKDVNEYFGEEAKEKRINNLENKLNKLESFKKVLEELGDEEKRINIVDKDAPVMTHKDGQKLPSYTHQSARDNKYGVATAAQSTQSNDVPEDLIKIADQSIENTGKEHDDVTADSGFCDYEVLQKVEEERQEEFYIPDKRYESSKKKDGKKKYIQEDFKQNEAGDYMCPDGMKMKQKGIIKYDDGHEIIVYEGTNCDNCKRKNDCTTGKKRTINIDSRVEYRDIMREKLNSEEGREIYMKRQGLIEPLHGDDQKNKGWIQHHLRGFKKASAEFILLRIATNLGCLVKHRSKEIVALAGT